MADLIFHKSHKLAWSCTCVDRVWRGTLYFCVVLPLNWGFCWIMSLPSALLLLSTSHSSPHAARTKTRQPRPLIGSLPGPRDAAVPRAPPQQMDLSRSPPPTSFWMHCCTRPTDCVQRLENERLVPGVLTANAQFRRNDWINDWKTKEKDRGDLC